MRLIFISNLIIKVELGYSTLESNNLSCDFLLNKLFGDKMDYKKYQTSVGNNYKHIQITPKYRYKMMRQEKLKIFCRVAIEETCKRHKIEIEIINVQPDHVHMIVDCPRTFSDAKLMQILKGLSAYLLFRICPSLRKRYPKGNFWSEGYFCCSIGANFDEVFEYVKNQDFHHQIFH